MASLLSFCTGCFTDLTVAINKGHPHPTGPPIITPLPPPIEEPHKEPR